jgi:phage I-like protein
MQTNSLFLSLNFVEDEIPARIQLVPAGSVIVGRDGRTWKNSHPSLVAEASNARLELLPIDENHATDLAAPKGGESPAFGWMKNLAADADGSIWAEVEWTERGKEALKDKSYRFISPVFQSEKDGEITTILRASLTNNPNLQVPALNSAEMNESEYGGSMKKELCAALGLSETATDAQLLAAVKAFNAPKTAEQLNSAKQAVDLEAYAPRTDLCAMEARAVAAEKQIADLNAAKLKSDAEAVVDEAIKARKIPPASREQYLAFCSDNAGLEKVRGVLAVSPAIISSEPQAPSGSPQSNNDIALNAADEAFARAAGYSSEEWKKMKEETK